MRKFLTVITAVLAVSFGSSTIGMTSVVEDAVASSTTLRLCTGGTKGNYFFSGQQIKAQAQGDITVEVISTRGTWDNFIKMSENTCDAAIVQADGWSVWNARNPNAALTLERVDVLYDEYVHLYCNRESGIDEVGDLEDNSGKFTILTGKNGSGSQVTWRNFIIEDDDYGPEHVAQLPLGGARARTKVKAGIDAQCALYVAGLNSSFMKKVEELSQWVRLVDVDDGDFNDTVDPAGNRVYTFKTIPEKTYPGLIDAVFSLDTVAVKAVLVVTGEWIDTNEDAYDRFIDYQLNAQKAIRQHVGQ